mmetsp:Transcript_15373/g.38868  ORF Transcript_15373/g.38868 Transcript_15373/m.38868 type:complete len:471 (-) Transcript_15373:474-1886(-)|eukprot:CAMPEP_0113868896 /NCGR_PEP_ID=MMETSP0780_2-20120614/1241_1 /TAXON_ID=652834 /ORGANISM="Palpitomonas bilix" /LENGTH=470 /DNA_ID=CAMNT_0000854025 /DNA_START=64 /DNA_END=1476 /DNA_ORIENTATION=- /assembly_acc=CAM_ASM_000599
MSGATQFWGFTPAADLFDLPDEVRSGTSIATNSGSEDNPINILIIYSGDIRHVLKTVARMRRHKKSHVNFYVLERAAETLARNALLLDIFLDEETPRKDRTELMLEVYGNTLLQEKTASWLSDHSRKLLKQLGNETGRISEHLDLGLLKFKERDEIDDAIKGWKSSVPFKVEELRDERLREFYKERFDHRLNLIDWDYHMKLLNLGAIIHVLQYRRWRERGLAYEVRDIGYNQPNRTLASMIAGKEKGSSVLRRGFWTDIVNSPYIAFGVEADDRKLFRRSSNQQVHNTLTVSEYNVESMLYEYETGQRFQFLEPKDTPKIVEEPESDLLDPSSVNDALNEKEKPQFKVFFLHGDYSQLFAKKKFAGLFDMVCVGSTGGKALSKELRGLIREAGGVLFTESTKFMLEVSVEQKVGFDQTIAKLREEAGLGKAVERREITPPYSHDGRGTDGSGLKEGERYSHWVSRVPAL